MRKVLLSIVMPVYNGEKTIADAMESAAGQTYRDWEMILVDDCSADGSEDRIREVLSRWPGEDRAKVRIFRNKENRGPAFCRNLGIAKAEGDYVAFLDCDDRWTPDKLEKQVNILREIPDAGLIFTGSGFLDEEGKPMEGYLPAPERIGYRELLKQNVISCSSVLAKKSLLLKTAGGGKEVFPDTRRRKLTMHEDFPVWLKCLRICGEARGVDEPLLLYRVQAGSRSGNKLRAAKMTYAVYRYMGIGIPERWFLFLNYAARSLKKYSGLLAKNK